MTDKTIRYTVDDKGVAQSNDRIRASFEDTQKRVIDAANSGRKVSKDELDDIQAKIRLIKQKNELEESSLRKRITDRQIEIELAIKELEQWKTRKKEEGAGLTGREKLKFTSETGKEEQRRRTDLSDERVEQLNRRNELNDTRETNKKQVRGLEDVVETLNKNTDKSIKSTENTFANVFRGATSGSVGGMASGLLAGAGIVSLVAGVVLGVTKSYQEGLKGYSSTTATPMVVSQWRARNARDIGLGISGTDVLNKEAGYSQSAGRRVLDDETKAYIGVTMSRGISDQMIGQMLAIGRFSNRSPLGAKEDFESYLNKSGKSLIQLPEILSSYLNVATEILNRTGNVDAMGVQRSIMTVGKSLGVSGVGLDTAMNGLMKMSTLSDNPFLLSIQQQAYRKLYPKGDPFDMGKRLQNPGANADLMLGIREGLKGVGGDGLYSKMLMTMASGGDYTVGEKLYNGKFKLADLGKTVGKTEEKELERRNYETGKEFVGSLAQIETALGRVKDEVALVTSSMIDIFKANGPAEQANTRAMTKGVHEGMKGVR